MNAKGLVSFTLVLVFLGTVIMLLVSESTALGELDSANSIILKMEQINSQRTLIENNLDFFIWKNLEIEFYLKDKDAELIEKSVNNKIFQFFGKKKELIETAGFQFKCCKGKISNKNYNSLSCEGKETLDEIFLNTNSKVIVVKAKELYFVTYIYTGGILKNEVPVCEICLSDFCNVFTIPAGYEKTVVVLHE